MLGRHPNTGRPAGSASTSRRVALGIVIPVYGCTITLRPLHERLTRILAGLVDGYEIVFVDDRGPDAAWTILQQLLSFIQGWPGPARAGEVTVPSTNAPSGTDR